MNVKELALAEKDWIISLRRYFHQHPELGNHELNTTKRIVTELNNMGIDIQTFPDITGCIGTIRGDHPGKTIMLRADIDALPIQEADLTKPYASQNPGVMHACGHDAHTAMLLGAAKILSSHRDEIHGTVKLIFQMAEEIGTESRHYVEKGCLTDVDAIFGMHIWTPLPSGTVNIEDGPRMASSDRFSIRIHGKSAHASAPHEGKDAIVAAAATVMTLQTLVSRTNNPQNTFVLTVGAMNGGTASNVIADSVELVGTTRAFDKDFRKTIPKLIENAAKETAAAYGCTADTAYTFGPAPLINEHKDLDDIARTAAKTMMGPQALIPMTRRMSAEDFSVYLESTPGLFAFLGCANSAKGTNHPHHSAEFDIDEDVLPDGTALYAQFAIDYLNAGVENTAKSEK